jgi:hypothetical protein
MLFWFMLFWFMLFWEPPFALVENAMHVESQ